MLASKGTSFHLEPNQSSPFFRIPAGKKAHVSVYGGSRDDLFGQCSSWHAIRETSRLGVREMAGRGLWRLIQVLIF